LKDNQEQEVPKIYYRVNEWFPDLGPTTLAKLKTYHEELLKFNRTLSLISTKSVFVADALHFADSINASKAIMDANPGIDKIYDLGSGNGFPGIVMGILYPKLQVVLVEVDIRKCEFLNHAVSVLGLSNVSVVNKNIESLEDGSVKNAICRGFANISRTLLLTRKLMPKGAQLFHMKGEEWGMEVSEIPTQLCSQWSPSLVGEYKLPVGPTKFAVVKTDKIA
jgi:16S rRNA (guanine527-N7)-methyltransferase